MLDVLDIRDIGQGLWYMCQISFCCTGRGSRAVGRGDVGAGGQKEDVESDLFEMT